MTHLITGQLKFVQQGLDFWNFENPTAHNNALQRMHIWQTPKQDYVIYIYIPKYLYGREIKQIFPSLEIGLKDAPIKDGHERCIEWLVTIRQPSHCYAFLQRILEACSNESLEKINLIMKDLKTNYLIRHIY